MRGLSQATSHEVVGRIEALGSGVSRWKIGQRVGVGLKLNFTTTKDNASLEMQNVKGNSNAYSLPRQSTVKILFAHKSPAKMKSAL
jgi:D-arabinose 1-dehydrogenase-like Zn-dependent alcohol dehydrogenase